VDTMNIKIILNGSEVLYDEGRGCATEETTEEDMFFGVKQDMKSFLSKRMHRFETRRKNIKGAPG